MLDEVVIEGYVSGRPWTHSGDQFFRLGSYRDRQRPAKRTTENRDEPDYVTARLASNGLPVLLQGGMRVRVHGYIQSRYYTESLGDWLKDAKGPTNALSAGDELRDALIGGSHQIETATALLARFNSVFGIVSASVADIASVRGIGNTTAALSIQEAGLKRELASRQQIIDLKAIEGWEEKVAEYLADLKAGLEWLNAIYIRTPASRVRRLRAVCG
jgi:hypothetical protein